MRIYFVRHGESEANVLHVITNRGSAYPLTEKGRGQVEALAHSLASAGITRMASSPLLRAEQTAQILSARLGVGYDVTDALREFDCGVLEGKSDADSWAIHYQLWEEWFQHRRWDSRIEGGESLLDIRDRFTPFLDALLAWGAGRDERVALIGHGGIYFSMLPLALTNVGFERVSELSYPNAGYVLAETTPDGLICIEWCGAAMGG